MSINSVSWFKTFLVSKCKTYSMASTFSLSCSLSLFLLVICWTAFSRATTVSFSWWCSSCVFDFRCLWSQKISNLHFRESCFLAIFGCLLLQRICSQDPHIHWLNFSFPFISVPTEAKHIVMAHLSPIFSILFWIITEDLVETRADILRPRLW